MTIRELINILSTIKSPETTRVFTLDQKDSKVEPSVHIDNYLNTYEQEVIIY